MLSKLPGVQECVVTARLDERGQNLLLGYVVAVPGNELDAETLRSGAGMQLPLTVVPAVRS